MLSAERTFLPSNKRAKPVQPVARANDLMPILAELPGRGDRQHLRPGENERGEHSIWLDRAVVDRLNRLRGPGESWSDVILRVTAGS